MLSGGCENVGTPTLEINIYPYNSLIKKIANIKSD